MRATTSGKFHEIGRGLGEPRDRAKDREHGTVRTVDLRKPFDDSSSKRNFGINSTGEDVAYAAAGPALICNLNCMPTMLDDTSHVVAHAFQSHQHPYRLVRFTLAHFSSYCEHTSRLAESPTPRSHTDTSCSLTGYIAKRDAGGM
jgi:hypothetical protein